MKTKWPPEYHASTFLKRMGEQMTTEAPHTPNIDKQEKHHKEIQSLTEILEWLVSCHKISIHDDWDVETVALEYYGVSVETLALERAALSDWAFEQNNKNAI